MATLQLRIETAGKPSQDRDWPHGTIVLGRGADADVVLADGSASRRHARIAADGEAWVIEDLGARNGTFVNGERISAVRRLVPGDVIQIGATIVRVRRADEAQRSAIAPLGVGELGSSIFKSVAELTSDEALKRAAPAQAAARLKALNEFHRALAAPISLTALLDSLLDQLFTTLHPEEGVILLQQADGSLATAASRRLHGATGELLISRRLVEEVVGKGTAACVSDVAVDERFAEAHSVIGAGVRSILAAPLIDTAGCVGMVAVYSRAQVRRFGDEDLELLVSLASAAALRIRNVALAEEAADRRVQDRELALAREIQMTMLPRQMPERREIDIGAVLTPAHAVGGDLYDFLVLDDDLWFVVADAAGKGVSAALYMAVTRTLFRALTHRETDVAALTGRMNRELSRENDGQFFVTAIVGRLNLTTGRLAYCNAGHLPPLHVTGGGDPQPLEAAPGGIALGVLEDATYAEGQVQLPLGSLLVLVTDGVTEATDAKGQMFSDARLAEVVRSIASLSSPKIAAGIVDAVTAFVGSAPQHDDLTVLAVRYGGAVV